VTGKTERVLPHEFLQMISKETTFKNPLKLSTLLFNSAAQREAAAVLIRLIASAVARRAHQLS
jgi:hypothetical protein